MPAYPGRMRNVTAMQRAQAEAFPIYVHRRITTAELNAGGVDLLQPAPGSRYRLIDCSMIAAGGAVGGATQIQITGVQAGATVTLVAVAVGGLTQSKMTRLGGPTPDMAILPDGKSHQPTDPGTAIKVIKSGPAVTGATSLDVVAIFLLEG